MTRNKHSRSIGALCIFAMLGMSACSAQEEEGGDTPTLLSDTEITLSLPGWMPIEQSRAVLYDDPEDPDDTNSLLDRSKGGGTFTLYAYVAGTTNTFINGTKAYYFDDSGIDPSEWKWVMMGGNGQEVTYYWPNSDKLNFFAYMPDKKYNGSSGYVSKETYVTIGSYSTDKGQEFGCALPLKVGNTANTDGFVANSEIQEFLYAYETKKTKADNPLKLNFKHPFAIINFQLKGGSYRMTVDNIKFEKIHLNGTFSTATGAWTPNGTPETYTAQIGKRVPNDVNYNTNLSGWFIVMPQDLNGVKMTLAATRSVDATDTNETKITGEYTFGENDKWEPGKKYTYIIKYGDNNEEIYFDVVAEPWFPHEQNETVE